MSFLRHLVPTPLHSSVRPKPYQYVLNGRPLLAGLHPLCVDQGLARAATALMGGQVIAKLLSERTRFTMEQLSLLLNGADLASLTDVSEADRETLLFLTQAILSITEDYIETLPDVLPRGLDELLQERLHYLASAPEEAAKDLLSYVPVSMKVITRFDTEVDADYASMDVLLRARGGVFSVLTGILLHYRDAYNQLHTFALDISTFSNEDEEGKTVVMAMKRLLDFRNQQADIITSKYMEEQLDAVVDSMDARGMNFRAGPASPCNVTPEMVGRGADPHAASEASNDASFETPPNAESES